MRKALYYIEIFLAYLLLWPTGFLPYSCLMKLGDFAGFIGCLVAKRRRKIAQINIDRCFADWPNEAKKKLLLDHFKSFGRSLFESVLAFCLSDKKFADLCEIKGWSYLESALNEKKGVILLSAHFTSMPIFMRLLSMQLRRRFCLHFRRKPNSIVEYFIVTQQKRYGICLIDKKKLHRLIGELKNNGALFYMPDQNFNYHNVFVPFFGIPASTVTTTSRIAEMSGAIVIPCFYYRKKRNSGYLLEFLPPLENFPGKDVYQDCLLINQTIEKAVKKYPEQYYWMHRRFRTQPKGEKSFYGD